VSPYRLKHLLRNSVNDEAVLPEVVLREHGGGGKIRLRRGVRDQSATEWRSRRCVSRSRDGEEGGGGGVDTVGFGRQVMCMYLGFSDLGRRQRTERTGRGFQ